MSQSVLSPPSNETMAAIDEEAAAIRKIIDEMEDIIFAPKGGDADLADPKIKLEYHLQLLYSKLVGALELYNLPQVSELMKRKWVECEDAGLPEHRLFIMDTGNFVGVPAWDVLNNAISALRVAVGREASREAREHAKDAEKRLDARRTLRLQSSIPILSVVVGIVFSRCDKVIEAMGGAAPSREVSVFHGAMEVEGGEAPESVQVVCLPSMAGVLPAAGDGRYSLTILPDVPRPLALFCTAHAPGYKGETVTVSVPKLEDVHPGRGFLPPLGLTRLTLRPE